LAVRSAFGTIFSLAAIIFAGMLTAQPAAAAESPIHDELRALRDGLVAAVNKGDLDGILSYCHPNVSITTPDAAISRGTEAFRKYIELKTKGPQRVVEKFSTAPTVDDLSTLYGDDAATATGSSVDHFELVGGMKFDLQTRWTATLVKENGKWLIATFHESTNVFDNPLLSAAERGLTWAAGIALLIGLLVGGIGMWFLKRRRSA
jgi:ketosteroid isomerase-like protein